MTVTNKWEDSKVPFCKQLQNLLYLVNENALCFTFKRDLADFCNFQSVLKPLVKHVAYEDLTFLGISFKTGSGVDCVADGGKVHSEVTAYVSYDCRTAVNAYAEADASAESLLEYSIASPPLTISMAAHTALYS